MALKPNQPKRGTQHGSDSNPTSKTGRDSGFGANQSKRGVQSSDSCASNGGITPASTFSIIRSAFSTALSYAVSENGAMPPS